MASEPVQVGHMPFRGQEGLILVLAVYVDQPPPHVPQDGDRHRAAADAAGPLPPAEIVRWMSRHPSSSGSMSHSRKASAAAGDRSENKAVTRASLLPVRTISRLTRSPARR